MPLLSNLKFIFDENIQKIDLYLDQNGSPEGEITTSGGIKSNWNPGFPCYCKVTLNSGYILDTIISKDNDSASKISNITENTFKASNFPAGQTTTITITSKKATSQVSIDLTTLSGWGNVADGDHVIQIVAKADGYRDSEKSTAVSFTKGSSFTQVPVTLTNPFSSEISWGASNAPFGRISNMDKTKIYSIQLTAEYFKTSITYLTYNGTQWVTNDSLINIKNQTETSVDLYKGLTGGSSDMLYNVIALEGTTQASVSDFTGFTGTDTMPDYVCLIEGTLVTLTDGTTKPIEDITYDDELLVWNFYDGKFDKAKPCWVTKPQIAHEYNLCKFSNGVEIGFVGQGGDIGYHRIYNDELKSFTHTGVKETPIGTHTFAQDGSKPTLIEQHIVNKQVRFYNVGTEKHINIFTNGILTSARISNKYAIKDMKYVGNRLISEQEEQEYINKKLERC
jgi:hypothetical protein